jgi:hypothetical protein
MGVGETKASSGAVFIFAAMFMFARKYGLF